MHQEPVNTESNHLHACVRDCPCTYASLPTSSINCSFLLLNSTALNSQQQSKTYTVLHTTCTNNLYALRQEHMFLPCAVRHTKFYIRPDWSVNLIYTLRQEHIFLSCAVRHTPFYIQPACTIFLHLATATYIFSLCSKTYSRYKAPFKRFIYTFRTGRAVLLLNQCVFSVRDLF